MTTKQKTRARRTKQRATAFRWCPLCARELTARPTELEAYYRDGQPLTLRCGESECPGTYKVLVTAEHPGGVTECSWDPSVAILIETDFEEGTSTLLSAVDGFDTKPEDATVIATFGAVLDPEMLLEVFAYCARYFSARSVATRGANAEG
jgi:hypothetical protein